MFQVQALIRHCMLQTSPQEHVDGMQPQDMNITLVVGPTKTFVPSRRPLKNQMPYHALCIHKALHIIDKSK